MCSVLSTSCTCVQALHAHSQFCISGDSTLEAAKHAIEQITKEDVDEKFVIVLSDANLERYGIPPKKLSEILSMDDEVNAFVIFIGSLGDQAQRFVGLRLNGSFPFMFS
jgi:von Willebrand factor A domain-containing protein 8